MTEQKRVTLDISDSVATIMMDDGKANVMSGAMLAELDDALDKAEASASVVVVTGREGMFSGGYDVAMFSRSQEEVMRTIRAGGELVYRILGFPKPVVMACAGHAIAQGAFLLLAADVRIGVTGKRKIGLNEVVIGLTIPRYGVEVARQRLSPAWFNHSTVTGSLYDPQTALTAGFFDRLVAPEELAEATRAEVEHLKKINPGAHAATKRRVRGPALAAIRAGLDEELGAFG